MRLRFVLGIAAVGGVFASAVVVGCSSDTASPSDGGDLPIQPGADASTEPTRTIGPADAGSTVADASPTDARWFDVYTPPPGPVDCSAYQLTVNNFDGVYPLGGGVTFGGTGNPHDVADGGPDGSAAFVAEIGNGYGVAAFGFSYYDYGTQENLGPPSNVLQCQAVCDVSTLNAMQ